MNRDYLFFLQQLCRDWSKKSNTNTVQPQDTATSKTALVSDGNGKTSPQQPTSAAIKKVQNQDSKSEGSNRSSTSSWYEYFANNIVTYYRLNTSRQSAHQVDISSSIIVFSGEKSLLRQTWIFRQAIWY